MSVKSGRVVTVLSFDPEGVQYLREVPRVELSTTQPCHGLEMIDPGTLLPHYPEYGAKIRMAFFLLAIFSLVVSYELPFQNCLSSLESTFHDRELRNKSLHRLVAIGGLGDVRLQLYYQRAFEADKDGFAKSLVDEICSEAFYDQKLFMLLVNRTGVGTETLTKMYLVRSRWWGDVAIFNKLRSQQKTQFKDVYDKRSTELENRDAWLSFWTDMIHSRALIGDFAVRSICIEALKDKRLIRTLARISDVPHLPAESRVCDYAFTALLTLHQVDQRAFFGNYDYQKIGWHNYGNDIRQLFDRVIADYPEIARKYFADNKTCK